jgi:uncharacterized protein YjbI with pentapeptide repeats
MDLLKDSSGEYHGERFTALEYESVAISDRRFYQCTFTRCTFREVQFTRCRFSECVFEDCDLSLMEVNGTSFRETRFKDSQVVGVNWTAAEWPDVGFLGGIGFEKCVINYAIFIGLNLHEIVIKDCVARQADFGEADLTGADCRDTDFKGARFAETNLTEANFRGAREYAINASFNTLKRTKFSLPEAMSLLYGLDIDLSE